MKFLIILLLITTQAQAKLNIIHWTTPEGAKVLFAQTQGLPMLDIALNFDAASSRDGAKFGLATLTNSLLGTASKYHSQEQIIELFESVGAQFSTHSLKDMSIVSLRTLTRQDNLQIALDILTEVVTQPVFKHKYLNREKKQVLRLVKVIKQSPASIASLAFDKAVFAGHPYGHTKIGTKESLVNISTLDLAQHYQIYYVAKNLTIALVGNISRTKAKQIARQISHGLNSGKKAQSNPLVKALKKSQNIHIEFPSKQTHLLIGQTGINRAHSDYYSLYLGNHILGGGGLTSILSDDIREQKGLAYSVVSYFTKMKSNGFFLVKLQTKNDQADQAKKIVIKTLKNFLNHPISSQQLQDGKNNIIYGFALKTASNASILTYLSIIGFYDLPFDYLSRFTDKIKNISAKDIQMAFSRLINMDKFIILSVGQTQ
ncbi:peptidase M16 domain protein [Candidatus Ruthia magnifica str. Cm (Calyptogena magnifica)]|uniref:Peptidase M16 domain protein n=1 Tax=Ruthia magnifica subsp. Calyptogena magnifica TaxID=413404 RepID=A1AX47_RUTMC|nr:pitrilysin family protein [Candidatus Ruthturnera calyptogenae]ABL02504.1 peptidase M16 domain protein [Candidatus Ruthia magnifica str. Cm (Calyptogena magnifica)]